MLKLPRTIEWRNGRVRLINQLKLPHDLEYIETDDWRRVKEAIRRMEVRGAPAIGVAAAFSLALAALSISNGEDVERAVGELRKVGKELKSTRPTAVNLSWAVDRVLSRLSECTSVREVRETVLEEAFRIQKEDEEANVRIGELGEELISDGDTVITVCNAGSLATSYYGTATAPIYKAVERGKKVKVLAMETRPYLQGARLTAWELSMAGVEVKVVTDNSIGVIMMKEKVDLAITGADRVTSKGYVANKIGTYLLALVSKEFNVPFYVAAPTSSIDMSISRPEDIEIERRHEREVLEIFGHRIAPNNVGAVYYAFDITPPKYVDGIITEKGIAHPPYEKTLRKIMSE